MSGFRIPFFKPPISEDDIEAVVQTLRSGWLTTGPNVAAFEEELAAYSGAQHVVALSSCTAAMHLTLAAWGVGPGDEVITTPTTFSATAAVAVHLGAKPVLADIREHDLNIDPEQVARAVTPHTKAIIPVHFGGEPCDMSALQEIADQHGLKLLEDAAHALGTTYRETPVGSISDAAAYSFYATKTITTGEGGALATNDPDLAGRVRQLSNHGISDDSWGREEAGGSWRYDVREFGYKNNLTDIAAALGRSQLKRIDELTAARTRAAKRYLANLADEPNLILPGFDERNTHTWHLFVVRVRADAPVGRNQVIAGLTERGIGTSVHFIPLHLHTAFKDLGYWREGDFPVAERVFEGAISLPMFPDITDAEVDDVCQSLRDILENR